MKTQSKKAKGRNLQKKVCSDLLAVSKGYGLEAGDIRSCSMGSNGLDVILSPAAQKVFGKLAVECKNRETLNVVSTFWQHAAKYKDFTPVLVHKKNKTEALVTLELEIFLTILSGYLANIHGS